MRYLILMALFLFLVFMTFLPGSCKSCEPFVDNVLDKIIYINLDNRTDRREEIESELDEKGLDYERFSAIKDDRGAIGCCKSHLAVLKKARDHGYQNILVLEDDFQFLVDKPEFEKQLKMLFDVHFDVCLLSYNTNYLQDSPYPFLCKITDAQTTSGYLVQSHYYDTLISQWEHGLKMFQETGNEQLYTCDQSWKTLQERDIWYCFKERIGIQRDSYSDIQNGFVRSGV